MDDVAVRGGGWADTRHLRMSENALALSDAADEEIDRQLVAVERRRRARAEVAAQDAVRAAIVMAQARGEYVNAAAAIRSNGATLGRTRAETLAWASAEQDRQDAHEQALARREGVTWERWVAEHSANVTPDAGEVKTAARAEASQAEFEAFNARAAAARAVDKRARRVARDEIRKAGL